ncbi:MAG TPA: TRAP transporter substrate-binding protein [Synergistales bacterium]|nr:TRAP transporter substrate-binding protein [Synergistales bacterium]
MKKIALLIAVALLASLVFSTAALAEKKPEFTLKLGHLANTEHTWHKGSVKFAELVEEKTGGRVVVQVFPSEQLGNEMEVIGNIQSGIVDMLITGESMMNWAPLCGLIAVPYMIRDSAHMEKIVEGEVGQAIEKEVIEKVRLRPVAWFERGARNLTSNREVKKPEDLNGLRLRVPNVPLFVATWESLGAKPTPMAFSEVFTSLQQGIIDGQENPYDLIKSASFFEVQKFVNKTEHVRGWIYLVIGEDKFQSMPEDIRKAVLEAGKEAQAYERQLFRAEQDQLIKDLQDKGMTFVEVDKEAFMKKTEPAVLSFLSPELQEMYKKIVAIQ